MDPTSGIQILTYSGRPICSPKFPGLPYYLSASLSRVCVHADDLYGSRAPCSHPLHMPPCADIAAACVQVFGQIS